MVHHLVHKAMHEVMHTHVLTCSDQRSERRGVLLLAPLDSGGAHCLSECLLARVLAGWARPCLEARSLHC